MTEILSLSTIVKRDTITLKTKKHPVGKVYEVANAADFGPYEYALLQQRSTESQTLLAKKKLTKKQEARVSVLVDETVKMIVRDLEPAVLRELTVQQKQSLVFAWAAHVTQESAEGKARGSRPTGDGSSRGSKPSTAATPKRGSTRRSGR